jgi:hypothetical protein
MPPYLLTIERLAAEHLIIKAQIEFLVASHGLKNLRFEPLFQPHVSGHLWPNPVVSDRSVAIWVARNFPEKFRASDFRLDALCAIISI